MPIPSDLLLSLVFLVIGIAVASFGACWGARCKKEMACQHKRRKDDV